MQTKHKKFPFRRIPRTFATTPRSLNPFLAYPHPHPQHCYKNSSLNNKGISLPNTNVRINTGEEIFLRLKMWKVTSRTDFSFPNTLYRNCLIYLILQATFWCPYRLLWSIQEYQILGETLIKYLLINSNIRGWYL